MVPRRADEALLEEVLLGIFGVRGSLSSPLHIDKEPDERTRLLAHATVVDNPSTIESQGPGDER